MVWPFDAIGRKNALLELLPVSWTPNRQQLRVWSAGAGALHD